MDRHDEEVSPESRGQEMSSLQQYSDLMRGPTVDIYVGVNENKKHYCLPKDILCHHSRYFERCFNGNFLESTTQKLELPEDSIIFFETLIEYLISGKMNKALLPKYGFDFQVYAETCRSFLLYGDKYELGSMASDIVCNPWAALWGFQPTSNSIAGEEQTKKLRQVMKERGFRKGIAIRPIDIEDIYAVTSKQHPLRELATLAALKASLEKTDAKDGSMKFKESSPFAKQEEVEGFAATMLQLIREQKHAIK